MNKSCLFYAGFGAYADFRIFTVYSTNRSPSLSSACVSTQTADTQRGFDLGERTIRLRNSIPAYLELRLLLGLGRC